MSRTVCLAPVPAAAALWRTRRRERMAVFVGKTFEAR
jgi:hypothetical protein